MQLNDALFNWLQIEIVREARPSDRSAADTVHFFEELLREEHQVISIHKQLKDTKYELTYQFQDQEKKETISFPREVAEKLLQDILAEPKYNQSFAD